MDDFREMMSGKKCGNARAIRNIALLELEGRKASKLVEPRLLQSRIVIGVKVVKPDDRPALLQKPARHVVADKTRGAGDEDGIKVGSHQRCRVPASGSSVEPFYLRIVTEQRAAPSRLPACPACRSRRQGWRSGERRGADQCHDRRCDAGLFASLAILTAIVTLSVNLARLAFPSLQVEPAFHFRGAGRRTLVPPGIPSNRRTRVTDTRRCNRPNLAVCALNAMRRARQSEGLVPHTTSPAHPRIP